VLSNIISFFGDIIGFFGNILSYLNPLSDNFILKTIIQTLANMLSYLNPFSENFFGRKIIELLGDLLELLFIPSQERLEAISNAVTSKFGFIDTIKNTINSLKQLIISVNPNVELTYNVTSTYYTGEVSVVNLSWYTPFKPYGDIVITGFVYLFFIWRLFIHAPNIIHGLGGEYINVLDTQERRFRK